MRYCLISLRTCSVLDIWFIVLTFQKPIFRFCFAVKNRFRGHAGVGIWGGDVSEAVVQTFQLQLFFPRGLPLKVPSVGCKPRAQPSSFADLGPSCFPRPLWGKDPYMVELYFFLKVINNILFQKSKELITLPSSMLPPQENHGKWPLSLPPWLDTPQKYL